MATLKISDLSVGDWVMVGWPNGERWRGSLTQLSVTGAVEVRCANGKHIRCSSDFITSIPITPEILEANGIHQTYECDEYAVYKGEGFNVTEYYTELWEIESRRNRTVIKSVHQLQHALRLAGVDKEIVMP